MSKRSAEINTLIIACVLAGAASGWPIVNFIAQNFAENLITKEIVLVLFMVVAFATAACCVALMLIKWKFSVFFVPIVSICFFSFGFWLEIIEVRIGITTMPAYLSSAMIFLQAVLFLIGVNRLQRSWGPKKAALVCITFLYLPTSAFAVVSFFNHVDRNVSITSDNNNELVSSTYVFKPNIYYIVLDMYARSDVLARELGINNTKFLSSLVARGFYVDDSSFSNYPTTPHTLSTSFNMDYYAFDYSYSAELIHGNSAVVEGLRSHGYDFLFIESGGNSQISCQGLEDICVKGGTIKDDVALILKMTPVWRLMRTQALYRYFEAVYILSEIKPSISRALDYITQKNSKPTFVFAHILSPHEPQRYNEHCENLLAINPGLGHVSIEGYKIDILCLNEQVIQAVDLILQNDNSDPIILVQSDHGINRADLGTSDKFVRLKNLMTSRLPKRCGNLHYAGMTPANNFHMVMACLGQKSFEPIADRYFFWETSTDSKFSELSLQELNESGLQLEKKR